MEIKLSEPFAIKFISQIFKPMRKNIISTTYNKIIDSRYRKSMQLNEWIKRQTEIGLPSKFYSDYSSNISVPHYLNYDKLIVDILKYVHKNFRYQTDMNNFGYVERWENLTETIKRKKGDCENLNALIYVMARMSGIPSFLLWNCIGLTTSGEGHYWLLYFSPRKADFYSIDSTYKPNRSYLQYRQPFKLSRDYIKIWYIFNENYTAKPR